MISSHDYTALLSVLNSIYPMHFNEVELHRDWIGYVYFVSSDNNRYVLKIYRSHNINQAVQTVEVLNYLRQNGFPVAEIIPAVESEVFSINIEGKNCVGVLFSYVEGGAVDKKENIISLGKQAAQLHNLMDSYDGVIVRHGKEFYIDRYLDIMRQMNYPLSRIDELGEYGHELWAQIETLPKGFCHNDMHTGNMIKMKNGQIALLDFDTAAQAYPFIDVAVMSDDTNFNRFEESGYELTLKQFDKFYAGYQKHRSLSSMEIATVFDFIAVRHYEIIANIIECQGLQEINYKFCDEQYDWLMRWRELCAKKRFFVIRKCVEIS